MGVMRIGHVNLRVIDVTAAVKHYEDVVGMKVTHRDDRGNVYLKCWDEWDKYSIVLSPANRAGLEYVAYKVEHDSDLDLLGNRIRDYGISTETLPEGALPLCGRSLRFTLPSGHGMCLFAQK